jgi:hypothetical protein
MRKTLRNIDKHTDADTVKLNILAHLEKHGRNGETLFIKSNLGYAGFPDYDFKAPQGAAFAVARIVREMEDDGLVHYHVRGDINWGYAITVKGREFLKRAQP